MGEKVKRKHAEQFRHLRDEAYGRLKDPDLFSDRQQVLARTYRCRGQNGNRPPETGTRATLMPQDDGRVLVSFGNRVVGEVVEEDCSALVALSRVEAILPVGDVSEQSELTGDFLVVCHLPDDENNPNEYRSNSR